MVILSTVAVCGLAIATWKVRGVGVGITGVLFAGLVAGHFGVQVDRGILDFVQEFGLILFVFTIGLQLGPSFFASLRDSGLRINAMAAGIVFLACVGLKAGEHFVPTLLGRDGLVWCAGALAITLFPLLAMGIFARQVLKMNFIVICGLFAGSMTDPPALKFANAITKSDSPSVAYATVYPLTMLLRIIVAQTLVLLLAG